MISHNRIEIDSSLQYFVSSNSHRLRDGKIGVWKTDGSGDFRGDNLSGVASSLLQKHEYSIPHEANTNPFAERDLGVSKKMELSFLHQSENIPECVWPWGANQAINLRKFLPTKGHADNISPYQFLNPNAPPVDMSWAKVMYCDCTVVCSANPDDVHSKLGQRGFNRAR